MQRWHGRETGSIVVVGVARVVVVHHGQCLVKWTLLDGGVGCVEASL